MKVVGVATSNSRAYYSIVSRLKLTHFKFVSMVPSQVTEKTECPIITTKEETHLFEMPTIALEELDEDPLAMEGQILCRFLGRRERVLLIGIDPGYRTGVAIYYGGVRIGSMTMSRNETLQQRLLLLIRRIPHTKLVIKIGNGAPQLSSMIARQMLDSMRDAVIEMVDERGTSEKVPRETGFAVHQGAAARIAFRKGVLIKKFSLGIR